jgi:hypothetical protein
MSEKEFEEYGRDVKKLMESLPETVSSFNAMYGWGGYKIDGGGYGIEVLAVSHDNPESPVVSRDAIHFNGAGEANADHETFRVERGLDESHWSFKQDKEVFNCTKTNYKPYDVMVCASLLALLERAPGAWRVSSDGSAREWVAAARFAAHALGRPMRLEDVEGMKEAADEIKASNERPRFESEREELKEVSKPAVRSRAKGYGL